MLKYMIKVNKRAKISEDDIKRNINLKKNLVINSRAGLETLKYFVV